MSRGHDFVERLRQECLVGCSARDDRFLAACSRTGSGPELLNLTHPALVRQVHGEYADTGVALLATNTAGANAFGLRRHGLEDRMREMNLAGTRLAVESAGRQTCVAGSVGPLGLTVEEDWDLESLAAAYRGQMTALLEGGVHLLQLESFTNLEELLFAIELAKDLCGTQVPIVAQVTLSDGAQMDSGEEPERVAEALVAAGADVVGVNGGRTIATVARAMGRLLSGAGGTPLAAYPNAGFPEATDGRIVYTASPAYMAENAVKMAKDGVRLAGCHCGATPEVIRAMVLGMSTVRPSRAVAVAPVLARATDATPTFKKGAFLSGLRSAFPVIAEIDPPGHLQYEPVVEAARLAAAAGADAISLAENPLGSLKMGNVAVASIIRREVGVQTICHLTCRDRNTLGVQSELMGAHALGIRAILAVTGDPLAPAAGGSRGVFELGSAALVRLLSMLNRGVSYGSADLKGETDFSVGVAFNSAARNLDGEAMRLMRKTAEGAQFVMTQPVFDADHGKRVLEATRATGARVFLGFFPLVSSRAALYLHNEVPGIRIPEAVLQRLASLSTREDQEKAGLDMACRLLEELKDELDGLYLISPHNRAAALVPLIRMVQAWREEAAPHAD